MTFHDWIQVFGIALAGAITLIVAYSHRKQLRQIEAFRHDPSVGLVPPPHPFLLFLKRRYALLIIVPIGICSLIYQLTRQTPVTRGSVFLIVLAFATIVLGFAVDLFIRILNLIGGMLVTLIGDPRKPPSSKAS